jgi:hypothetical protein
MAGRSGKKEKQLKESNSRFFIIAILAITAFYILTHTYSVIFKEYEYTTGDLFGFLFLSFMNYMLYKLIGNFIGSYFYLPLIDILIINLLVMFLINFHRKGWLAYLLIPGYLLYKGWGYLYAHVKTIGQGDSNEPQQPEEGEENKTKKKKIVKVKAN